MKSCLLLTAACLFSAGVLQAADTEAPFITSFEVSPTAVDISSGDATVQVTLHITDNDIGFQSSNVYLYNPTGSFVTNFYFTADNVQPGGDDKDGTYIVDVIIPEYGKEGNWTLDGFVLDKNDNRRFYGSGNTPLPGPGNTVAVTTTGDVDIYVPVIQSLAISPSTVDVTTQSQTVTVTLRITDDPSGLRYGSSILYDDESSQTGISHFFTPDEATGTSLDGTYSFDLHIPGGTKAGIYQLGHQLRDRVGNIALVYNLPDSYITVVNNSIPAGDISDACDATQFDWRTRGNEIWFHQIATTYDGIDAARSGPIGDGGQSAMEVVVSGPGTLKFWWKTDCANGDFLAVETTGSGDSDTQSGQTAWTEVSLDIEEGEQTVTWTYAKDSSGSAGQDCGFVDRMTFEADDDGESPRIQYLNISPNPASVANGDVDVTLKIEISDDHSGFSHGNAKIVDPNGNALSEDFSDSEVLAGGDNLFGTYQVTFTISQADLDPDNGFLSLGDWHAEIEVNDNESNSTTYGGSGNDAVPIAGTDEFVVIDEPLTGSLGIASIDSFVPDTVDVSAGTQTMTINFTLDDPSGIFGYGNLFLYRQDGEFVDNYFFDGSYGSGGQFSVTVDIPRYGQPGQWRVAFLLTDQNDNGTDVGGPIQNPGDDEFTVINTSGEVDLDPPVVSSISIAPKVVDTSTGPAEIAVTVGISDPFSGLAGLFLYFIDPSGHEIYQYVDGDSIVNNTFTVNRTLPQGSEEGVWHCSIGTRDKAGNYLHYGPGTGETSFPVAADAEFTVGQVTGSSFAAFTTGYSLTGNDALLGANPDNDWASNALEFLLGLDPTIASAPDPAIYQASRLGDELRLDFKPDAGLTITGSGDFLVVANAAGDAPVRVTGQVATDLAGPWTNILPLPAGGGAYRVALPIGTGERGFCRLMFQDP